MSRTSAAGSGEPTGPLLLDTHVWIWMAEGDDRRMPARVIDRVEEAGRKGMVLVHPISVWEVGTLIRKGRLVLSLAVESWVERALGLPGIFLLSLTPESALEAALLASEDLSDPADCMLVAAARLEDAHLVTADRRILDFARDGGFRTLAVG